jgi:hypothetical protein
MHDGDDVGRKVVPIQVRGGRVYHLAVEGGLGWYDTHCGNAFYPGELRAESDFKKGQPMCKACARAVENGAARPLSEEMPAEKPKEKKEGRTVSYFVQFTVKRTQEGSEEVESLVELCATTPDLASAAWKVGAEIGTAMRKVGEEAGAEGGESDDGS